MRCGGWPAGSPQPGVGEHSIALGTSWGTCQSAFQPSVQTGARSFQLRGRAGLARVGWVMPLGSQETEVRPEVRPRNGALGDGALAVSQCAVFSRFLWRAVGVSGQVLRVRRTGRAPRAAWETVAMRVPRQVPGRCLHGVSAAVRVSVCFFTAAIPRQAGCRQLLAAVVESLVFSNHRGGCPSGFNADRCSGTGQPVS